MYSVVILSLNHSVTYKVTPPKNTDMKQTTFAKAWLILLMLTVSQCLHAQSSSKIGLRTNLASWLTLAPNLGAEIYFNKSYSITVDGSYGWWGFSGKQNAFQTWSIGGEAAYWFKTDSSFSGHHLGLSVRSGQFDVKYGDTGRRGQASLAGIAYGYNWCIGNNWLIDAGLGIGYVRKKYDKYEWDDRFDDLHRIGKSTRNSFGMTDLHVSLIYRFPTK